ncbi:MAG: hypothetical protein JKY37_14755 [Nannocystaceae bacterium]|nr:hypothetical protein [Nannocystaceae bacterium]
MTRLRLHGLLLPLFFGCAFASPSTSPEESSSRKSAKRAQEICEAYGIGGSPSADPLGGPDCDQADTEQRAFDEEQTGKIEASIDAQRESEEKQAGVDRELAGDALAGDGQFLGQGWYCYDGKVGEQQFGACNRDAVECGMALQTRKSKGMSSEYERCERFAQAACFQATRSLKDGPKVFCFPGGALCTTLRETAVAREDVTESTECATYR